MNFIRKIQKVASAERIVFQDFGCGEMPTNVGQGMRRSFRVALEAGGNEYDAAVGFMLGITLERLQRTPPGVFLTDQEFDRVSNIVNQTERLLPQTLLLKTARDIGSVLAEIRLLAARVPAQ